MNIANKGLLTLTIAEKINACLLEGNDVPAFIVEGNSDFAIYSRILSKSNNDWRDIDFVICYGKKEFFKYFNSGFQFRYIALIDSDYDKIEGELLTNEFIIYTHYYNIENYLTTAEVIAKTLEDFETLWHKIETEKFIEEIIANVKFYITVCYVKFKNNWPIKLETIKIYRWWDEKNYLFKIDDFSNYIIDELKMDLSEFIILCKKYESEIESKCTNYDFILNGKRKLEVTHALFLKYYPFEKNRNLKNFQSDLLKNIYHSPEVNELINLIDDKFSLIKNI